MNGKGESVSHMLQTLSLAKTAEAELCILKQFKDYIVVDSKNNLKLRKSSIDSVESEWLNLNNNGFIDDDNPFPFALPEDIFLQPELDVFVYYVFDRRYGWSECPMSGNKLKGTGVKEAKLKTLLNEILHKFITWWFCQPIKLQLLLSLKNSLVKVGSKPVVRNQTMIHIMEWLKSKGSYATQQHFPLIKTVIQLGLVDVWSAIRKASQLRLGMVIEHFSVAQLENFFNELVTICQAEESTWQAKEGAITGINCIVRSFQWIGVVLDNSNSACDPTKTEYFLRFGNQDFHGLPEFLRSAMSDLVFPLLAHPQLTVRENTIKAFSSYLARCDFQEGLTAFKNVIKELCRDTDVGEGNYTNKNLPHLAVLRSEYNFMNAYEAEGLLGVCVYLVKQISPGFLLPDWPLYMSTFNLYLMHPASTVRQATSLIFKFLVAKDSHNPILLKLVLQGLSYEWQVDWTLLTQVKEPTQPVKQENEEKFPKSLLQLPVMKHSHRRTSINRAGAMDSGKPRQLSDAWEWREGRLLAYELIFQFLIKNHWVYTFGPPHLCGPPAVPNATTLPTSSVRASADEAFWRTRSKKRDTNTGNKSYGGDSFKSEIHQNGTNDAAFQGVRCANQTESPLSHIIEEDCGRKTYSRHRTNSFGSVTSAIDIPDGLEARRRARASISSCSPIHELPPSLGYIRQATEASSSAGATDVSKTTSKLYQRMPTVVGGENLSLKTLVRHYSYYTQCDGNIPNDGSPKLRSVNKSASLLMHTLAMDIQSSKGVPKSNSSTSLSSLESQDAKLIKSCLRSPRDTNSSDQNDPAWLQSVILPSLSTLLTTLLHHCLESIADPRWEVRRMGGQLLPCLVEVVRWFDMRILEDLWSKQLKPLSSLLTFGSCLALKYSLSHAIKLKPMATHPPITWQDPEMCRQAVLHITDTISRCTPELAAHMHTLLIRPVYDKLTSIAIETIMLMHVYGTAEPEQKQTQCQSIVDVITSVFTYAHRDTEISRTLLSLTHIKRPRYVSPSEGFLCCTMKHEGDQYSAQQVEKSILSDCSSILCAFFTCSATQVVLPLMPILAYVLPVYAQDESLCKSLMDSGLVLSGFCSSHLQSSPSDVSLQYCCLALQQLADISAQKTTDLQTLRQVLDIYATLCEHITAERHLKNILNATVCRLNQLKDLSPVLNAQGNGKRDLSLLSNDIPVLNHQKSEDNLSEEDENLDPTPGGGLQESQILNISTGSSSSNKDGRPVKSPAPVPGSTDGGSESDEDSDWDSWSDDETEEDQTALSEIFSEFLCKLERRSKKLNSKSTFSQIVATMTEHQQKIIHTVMSC